MPTHDLVIRPAESGDLGAIRVLLAQLGYELEEDETRQRFELVIHTPGHTLLAGAAGGRVVALLHFFVRPALDKPPEIVVQALVVDENCRQSGAGAAMMKHAERWAVENDYGSVALYTGIDRAGAHAFYRRLGYEQIATSHLMRKTLNTPPAKE